MNVYFLNFLASFESTQLTSRSFRNQQKVGSVCQAKIAGHLHSGNHRVQDASAVRGDWERGRKIGEYAYPYDKLVVPGCVSCQDRKQRLRESRTYEIDKCRRATRPIRVCSTCASRPREPQPKADAETAAGAPATLDGKELGQGGEEAVARQDRELREGRERRQAKRSDASGSQQAEAGAEPQRSSSSASSSSRTPRGPDHFQRSRTVRDKVTTLEIQMNGPILTLAELSGYFAQTVRVRSDFRYANFVSGGGVCQPTQ
jgi:hypothetical protein